MRHLTEQCGYLDLRPSLGPLLSLVAIEPRPVGALASQLSVSPQACSQLVNLGEAAGYLERRANRPDRRSRQVVLTQQGRALVEDAARFLDAIESEYRELLGGTAYERLTDGLAKLFHGLDLPGNDRPGAEGGQAMSSSQALGVLPLISVRIQQDLMRASAARGHDGLKMSHAQVLPLIGPEGARANELAQIQRVSRQAISTTARDLEQLGYLRREADPRDRRGVVFRLTPRGARLIEASVAALDELDDDFRDLIGARALQALQTAARALYQALHLEEEIFEARTSRPSPNGDGAQRIRETDGPDLEGLAARLRRQLGSKDAGRLAALLEQSD